MDKNKVATLAGKGAAVALTATFAFGIAPAVAVAAPVAGATLQSQDGREAYESAYQVYYKGVDASAQYVGRSFRDKVTVVPQTDGTSMVKLTANSLGDAAKLGDVTVGGTAVKYTDNADGSRTYELPVADVKGTTDFTFSYTISSPQYSATQTHPFQLVLEGGTYAGYTATREFLTEQIASAKRTLASGDKKSDEAKATFQAAIDAAQKVADDQSADGTALGKAVQSLDAASKAFKAEADQTEQGGLEEGKTYSVPASYLKTGSTEQSMTSAYMEPTAKVTVKDGTYTVVLRTKLTAEQKGWISDLKVDGTAATQTAVDENNLEFTFTTTDLSRTLPVSLYVQPMGYAPSLDVKLDAKAATPETPSYNFTDVDKNQWYASAVDFVSSKGLMTGYTGADGKPNSVFGVNEPFTRAQFAAVLFRNAQGVSDPAAKNETGLADVEDGQWYTSAANWAVKQGLITGSGTADGSKVFAPNGDVTLEQMSAIVARLNGVDLEKVDTSVLDRFADKDSVSDWAKQAVAWGVQSGLFSGSVEGDVVRLRSGEGMSRARVAAVIMNAFNKGLIK